MKACADRQEVNNILSPLYNLGSMIDMGKLRKTYFLFLLIEGIQCASFTIIRFAIIHVHGTEKKVESSCFHTKNIASSKVWKAQSNCSVSIAQ